MRSLSLIAPVLSLWLGACTQPPCPVPAEPAMGGVLQGQVRDAAGKPVTGALVLVADATGAAIPGTMRARSDDQGNWWTAQLPAGFTFVIVARVPGPNGPVMSTLGRPTEGSAARATDVTPATTILTVAALQGRAGMPGPFDADNHARAVALVEQALVSNPAPTAGDPAAASAWLAERRKGNAELSGCVDQLVQETGKGGSRDQVEAQVGARQSDPLDALKPVY